MSRADTKTGCFSSFLGEYTYLKSGDLHGNFIWTLAFQKSDYHDFCAAWKKNIATGQEVLTHCCVSVGLLPKMWVKQMTLRLVYLLGGEYVETTI